jgi:hypothetical protein
LDEEEQYRVNAFDWKAAFPEVFSSLTPGPSPKGGGESKLPLPRTLRPLGEGRGEGGFDVVIGNPPYIRIQTMQEWTPSSVEYFKRAYRAASKGNYDIYVVFVEKGLGLLNPQGRLGFILPHKFFNAQYGQPLRELLADGQHLARVVHFGDQQVFHGATTYTCLLFLDKAGHETFEFEKVSDLPAWRASGESTAGTLPAAQVGTAEWNFTVGKGADLFERMSQMPVKLSHVAERIFQGFKTGADPVFILEIHDGGRLYSNALKKEISVEHTYLRPLFKSGNMKRYSLHENSRYVIFPYRDGQLIPWDEIVSCAPNTAEYLKTCKELLAQRENGRFVGAQWYCYSRNQALEIISSKKILTADLNPFASYCFDQTGQACFPGGAAGGYGIVCDDYLYILGLLNSRAVDFYHKKISTNYRGGWFGYDAKVIRHIPIRPIDPSSPADVQRHERMVALVEQMLDLQRRLAAARTPAEQTALQRQAAATDQQIDALVYALYGLTEEEIKIVEGG